MLVWLLSVFTAVELTAAELTVDVVRITRATDPIIPLSLIDLPIDNEGEPGIELGLADNQTTGGFLGHTYSVEHVELQPEDDAATIVAQHISAGRQLFVLDLPADDVLSVVSNTGDALFLNARSTDDHLRGAGCHPNLLHLAPSRAMLTDALAQYLAWKRWGDLILVTGRHPEDAAFADAMRRSIKRFGLKLIDESQWTREPGARRTDSGHHSAQQEIPSFTQFKNHSVLVVADERDEFGEYLSYRSTRPRPVAGTQGLKPTAWARTHEQWGATQIQRRFDKIANRSMTERDYAAWLAMRAIGEAVTQLQSADAMQIREFLLSDKLTLAGFKGVPLSFRQWNGQLRQPILLTAPRMLISVSPQDGFLHEHSELDTLGFDEPESLCSAFADSNSNPQ